jgi:hypothetical protein
MEHTPEVIADRIGPLVEPLNEAFEMASYRLDNNYPGLCRDDQGWLRTHNLRGLTYQHLADATLPDRWILTGNHRQNGAVNLTFGSGEITMRFVHAFPSGMAPTAGPNRARRAYYTQQAITEFCDPEYMPPQRLLMLWEETPAEAGFALTVIRPLTPGSRRRQVRSDLEIPLPRTLSDFENQKFDTADATEMLFEVDEDDLDTGTDE